MNGTTVNSRSNLTRRRGVSAAIVLAVAACVAFTSSPADAASSTLDTESKAARPTSIAYVEVNNEDLANVGRYSLADGSPVFDVAIIFAANMNYDGSKAVLSLNDRVQATLDDAENQIRPLQERGIKVSLSILGNHQGAGIANFTSPEAAADFSAQVTAVVDRYGLDGVDLDDEYSDYGANGTPQPNGDSTGWLISALRNDMPDAVLSFYDIGPASAGLASEDPAVNAQLDYAWNPYYGTYSVPNIPGLSAAQLSPAAVNFQSTPMKTVASLASRTIADGYGVFLTYNLSAGNQSRFVSSFTKPLYGQTAKYR